MHGTISPYYFTGKGAVRKDFLYLADGKRTRQHVNGSGLTGCLLLPQAMAAYEHPVREGVPDCCFYIKTGQCKFGLGCKYNHPPQDDPVRAPLCAFVDARNSVRQLSACDGAGCCRGSMGLSSCTEGGVGGWVGGWVGGGRGSR